jgi:hypothetical protein
MKRLLRFIVPVLMVASAQAQTPTDGLMMPKNNFCTGFMGTYDKWTDYWEGNLKRENGNIGSISTTSVMWYGNYGVTDKLNVIASVPFVSTKASAGTLHGMHGIQDLMVTAKYKLLEKAIDSGKLRVFGVAGAGLPLTDYTPDFFPLSIGAHSKQATGRLIVNYYTRLKLYVNTSVGYTFRGNVELDRPSYYTDGQIYFTNQVDMPNVLDFTASIGYINRGLETKLTYMQQSTLGGGDIRRQDMPFVSNMMNYSKAELLLMYYLPKPKYFALRGSYSYTVAGRNVGQSSTIMGGILYTFHFSKSN